MVTSEECYKKYLECIKTGDPRITFYAKCFHYEAIGTLYTHKAKQRWKYDKCFDESDMFVQTAPIQRCEFVHTLKFKDQRTKNRFIKAKKKFKKINDKDDFQNFACKTFLPNNQKLNRLLIYDESIAHWIKPHYYIIASIFLGSFPFRFCLAKISSRKTFIMKKVVQKH